MPDTAKCFMVYSSNVTRRFLRRYGKSTWDPEAKTSTSLPCPNMPGPYSYHDASVEIERGTCELVKTPGDPRGSWVSSDGANGDPGDHSDPRWPATCSCGYVFAEDDQWQLGWQIVYLDDERGEHLLHDRTPGMMWDAIWMPDDWCAADGRSLVVVLPIGREWAIDGTASNCTAPEDREHKCWIRHGTPPFLTVDKNAGTPDASAIRTCAAGAGSIAAPGWHGFLRAGVLAP